MGCLDSNVAVTLFWKELQDFGEKNAKVVSQLETYQWGFSSIECYLDWWKKSVLGIIFKDDMDFDTRGAPKYYWLNVSYIVPLVAYRRVSLVGCAK